MFISLLSLPLTAANCRNRVGFTLIEVVVSLVITGILAAIAGLGIVSAINSYAVVKENVHLSQQSQLTATRISRELLELTDIGGRDAVYPYVIYATPDGQRQAIARIQATIKLYDNLPVGQNSLSESFMINNGDILTDRAEGFSIDYFQGTNPWDGSNIRELSAIRFTVRLSRSDTTTGALEITTTVHPRNNGNYGGSSAAPPPAPPTSGQYCFISTILPATVEAPSKPGVQWAARFFLFALAMGCLLVYPCCGPASIGVKQHLHQSAIDSCGSALVGVIITIMVFAALGAAIVPMISTSQLHRTGTSKSTQAYFLAESGHRYAASQYLNAADETARHAAMNNLHNFTYTLRDNQGAFTLTINPYYFSVVGDPVGTQNLQTRVYGALADGYALSGGGRLKIDGSYYDFSSAAITGSLVTFTTLPPVLPSIPVDTPVYPVARTSSDQSLSRGGTLALAAGTGQMFPDHNGSFDLNDVTYTYRENDRDNDILIGMQKPDGDDFENVPVSANTDVDLKKFLILTATGNVGSGEMAASRKIVYYTPLPDDRLNPQRVVVHDRFDDLNRWNPSVLGLHAVEGMGGNNVLRVAGVYQSGVDSPSTSLIALNTSAVQFNPDHFDTQVKIGYTTTPSPPTHGYSPSPIPTYYSAGLCFRLFGNADTYGLSFQRGNISVSPPDNIENTLIPVNDMHAIVLWQATNNGTDKQWLAYKQISDTAILSEDVEIGSNGWTTVGDASGNDLWHIDSHPPGYGAGSHAWYYGASAIRTYNTGNRNYGTLISPPIDLCDYTDAQLRFSSWHATDPNSTRVNASDYKYVDVSTDNGASWDTPPAYQITADISDPEADMRLWQDLQVDLSAYTGQTIVIRFRFDTWDDQNNDWEGWYIDNIRIVGDNPVDKSTLLARFKASASATFNSGGPDVIEHGDRIIGSSSGASATVYGLPVIQLGSWAASNAVGTLLLDKVNGTFQINERLSVAGKSELATLTGFRAQDHFIKVYLGTESGCGIPNTDPLDGEKKPNPLDPAELNWPPDEGDSWTADKDYFQLIQWDAVNVAVGSVDWVDSIDEPHTLIRSSEAVLMGTGSTLGLHTFGKGSLNIYYDDFGYQSFVDQPVAISQPIQY